MSVLGEELLIPWISRGCPTGFEYILLVYGANCILHVA